MAESLANKVCVVTGAGSGIGKQLVTGLLADGATVYGLDRDQGRLFAVTPGIPGNPHILAP